LNALITPPWGQRPMAFDNFCRPRPDPGALRLLEHRRRRH
jgi:hypothetical protein